MAKSSVQQVRTGDLIVESTGGKRRMTPVKQIEFNACSSRGVHINRNSCYDFNAIVDLVPGDGTLGDLEKELTAVGDHPEDLDVAVNEAWEAFAEGLVRV